MLVGARKIEDYALIGNGRTAALVHRDGAIDWWCPARFDAEACFAALLGGPEHGHWRIAPRGEVTHVERRYRPGTLMLETVMHTADGVVRLTDWMPVDAHEPRLLRRIEGVSGCVPMTAELVVRFDYGDVVPWVRTIDDVLVIIGGPGTLDVRGKVPFRGEGLRSVARFELCAGQRVEFDCAWRESHRPMTAAADVAAHLRSTEDWWRAWTSRCTYDGPYREEVLSSLAVLKALIYAPTGGIVAAPTTSLPEWPGGVRNWDYRYCWLRDAAFTLQSLMLAGFTAEASAWRDWLLRAVAGDPRRLQIMYGVAGERRLTELELGWLPGYGGASPVRVGNDAAGQVQLDVYGEVMDALFQARCGGLDANDAAWRLQAALLEALETRWTEPDEGIWEVRGGRRHFTHSKVMAWVAFDRGVRTIEAFRYDGPLARWRALRDAIHNEVCERAYDTRLRSFTQSYGSSVLDASLLLIPEVGFLPPSDPRVTTTVAAIEKHLMVDGLVTRYPTEHPENPDGLPPGEAQFVACSYWLADCYELMGRHQEARALFERLSALRNDVGLLAEMFDVRARRQLGNFPQAFSHVALVETALHLGGGATPKANRAH